MSILSSVIADLTTGNITSTLPSGHSRCACCHSPSTAHVWHELKVGVETGYICHSCMDNLKHSLQKKIIKECN